MSILPSHLKYTEAHIWVYFDEAGDAVVGITDYAQESSGEILEVYLPKETTDLAVDDTAMALVAERLHLDILAPISGEVIEANEALFDQPSLINMEPYDGGWLFKLTAHDMNEMDDLMDDAEYADYIERPLSYESEDEE